MTVLSFERPLDVCNFDVTLTKGAETRRFWVRPGRDPGTYWGQIFFGTTQHRACIAGDRSGIERFVAECFREMAAYERDGWARAAPPPPARLGH